MKVSIGNERSNDYQQWDIESIKPPMIKINDKTIQYRPMVRRENNNENIIMELKVFIILL